MSMGRETTRDAALRQAQAMTDAMGELTGEIRQLTRYGQRTRRMTWGLAASLLLDVVLTVWIGVVTVQSNETAERAEAASSLAEQNKRSALLSCVSANESRKVNRELWTYVLTLAEETRPERSPKQQRRLKEFRAYVANTFADRACDKVGQPRIKPSATPATTTGR